MGSCPETARLGGEPVGVKYQQALRRGGHRRAARRAKLHRLARRVKTQRTLPVVVHLLPIGKLPVKMPLQHQRVEVP
jgi:hypothetical protein